MRTAFLRILAVTATLLFSACGSDHDPQGRMMTGPSRIPTAGLTSAYPGMGMTVSVGATIVLRFSVPMAVGMEQWIDLHRGDLSGDTVAMSCTWSTDRTTLTCQPQAPLTPGAYALHVGAGMHDANGNPVDLGAYQHGGQWVMPGYGPMHAGNGWGMMGPGWRGSNGSYGMVFVFSVA